MIELRDYQKKAVRELKQKMIDMLNDSEDRQKLIFKAPTGAGKTVMVSTLLDELTRDLPMNGQCRYSRVAWVWIAPNKLHQQSYRSMRNFHDFRRMVATFSKNYAGIASEYVEKLLTHRSESLLEGRHCRRERFHD